MKLAIMQPYFLPYIGYFQLINSVDKFVFYDDVNFIKSGWINRNRLYGAGAVRYMTLPLIGASSFQKINRINVKPNEEWAPNIISTVAQYYGKAPFYKPVSSLLKSIFANGSDNLATMASRSVMLTADYLGLLTEFVITSEVYGNQEKKSVERVLDICRIEQADEYWNLPGGLSLYNPEVFSKEGIKLKFVNVSIQPYKQSNTEFSPGLSILDVLMYNEPSQVVAMLNVNEQH